MTRIDSHHHFWQYNTTDYGWIDDSMHRIQKDFLGTDFEQVIKPNGVTGTVVVQVNQTLEENTFMLDLAKEHEYVKGVVGWVDLMSTDLEETLETYKSSEKLKGFRHIAQVETNDFLSQPRFIEGVKKLSKYGFTYDILINPAQLRAAIELVAACPEQKFVLDHLAKPYIKTGEIGQWESDLTKLAEYDNVWCKVSGMVTEADWKNWQPSQFNPYLDVALECFGAKRLMFGSDWPVCLVAAEYEEVISSIQSLTNQLSITEQEQFWALNATEFYQLT